MDNSNINRTAFLKNKQPHYPGQSPDKEIKDLKLKLVFWGYVVVFEFLVFFVIWEWLKWYYHTPPQPIYLHHTICNTCVSLFDKNISCWKAYPI